MSTDPRALKNFLTHWVKGPNIGFMNLITKLQDLHKIAPARHVDEDSTIVRPGDVTPLGRFCVSPKHLRRRTPLPQPGMPCA